MVMHIGTNNKLYSYNMNNATLKTVDVERVLGVFINKNGKYSEQCLMAAKKANCVLGMIKRNIKCKNAIIMRLYKSLVRPRLEYCIQASSPYHKKDIEVLERESTKTSYKNGLWIWVLNYKDRLSLLDLPSLEERRVRGI